MNWGYKIVFASLLFMGYIVFLVVKCFQQDISLVDTHYYKEEIEYQSQIEKIKKANYSHGLSIKFNALANKVELQFNDTLKEGIKGTVQLFRPSDDKMDKRFPLAINEKGEQSISTSQLAKGLWKIKVSWANEESAFYKEEVLVF